jgi:hypothetical protein
VPASQRAQANALFRTGRNTASIGGAALGGLITGLAGPGWALAADAASYTAAAALGAGMRFQHLPPARAHASLGGARSWGLITAYAAGAVAGGLVMTRYRPRRLLVAAMLSVPAYSLLLFALVVLLPAPSDLAAALVADGSLEVFTVCWASTMRQGIPPGKLSRVASYDALGSIALTPAATAIVGPAATTIGTAAS